MSARRRRPNAFVPLLLLLLLLAVYGVVNKGLLDAYHGPQAVADAQGALVFYDDGSSRDARPSERSFFIRKSADGKKWDKAQRVDGALVAAALRGENELVCLFPDFFSLYDREQKLDRAWSGSIEGLPFQGQTIERLRGEVYLFGSDEQGALRAASLETTTKGSAKTWRFSPLDTKLDKATEPPPGGDPVEKTDKADEAKVAPAPVGWAGAQDRDGTLALLYRVLPRTSTSHASNPLRAPDPPAGELRLARFDGKRFEGSSAIVLDDDLTAFAATAVTSSGAIASIASSTAGALAATPHAATVAGVLGDTAEVTTRVLVFGTRRNDPEPRIVSFLLEGSRLVELESIPYKKGGFFREDQGVQALAACSLQGRILLFAQIGGSVKEIVYERGRWGEWKDFATLPVEAMALVYGYLGSMLALALIMIVTACVALARRARAGVPALREMDAATAEALVAQVLAREPAAAGPVQPVVVPDARPERAEDDASIPDRFVAFGLDLAIVLGVVVLARSWLEIDPVTYLADDPVRSLAVVAWLTLGFVAYLTVFEVALGRTPGKHLLGLEVRGLDGEKPPVLARLYRNLFRVELLFFATPITIPVAGDQHLLVPVPLLALVVMVATQRNQRPGDLVAGTVVQRVRPPRLERELDDDAQPATSPDDED